MVSADSGRRQAVHLDLKYCDQSIDSDVVNECPGAFPCMFHQQPHSLDQEIISSNQSLLLTLQFAFFSVIIL